MLYCFGLVKFWFMVGVEVFIVSGVADVIFLDVAIGGDRKSVVF